MLAFHSNANARARSTLAVHAKIAPSKPQQATARKAPSVNAKVNYVKPARRGEELFTYLYEKPEDVSKVTNLEHIETEVPFTDLRTIEDQEGQFTLQRNGFQLEPLHVSSDIDWTNDDEVGVEKFSSPVWHLCRESPAMKLLPAPTALMSILTFACNHISLRHCLYLVCAAD